MVAFNPSWSDPLPAGMTVTYVVMADGRYLYTADGLEGSSYSLPELVGRWKATTVTPTPDPGLTARGATKADLAALIGSAPAAGDTLGELYTLIQTQGVGDLTEYAKIGDPDQLRSALVAIMTQEGIPADQIDGLYHLFLDYYGNLAGALLCAADALATVKSAANAPDYIVAEASSGMLNVPNKGFGLITSGDASDPVSAYLPQCVPGAHAKIMYLADNTGLIPSVTITVFPLEDESGTYIDSFVDGSYSMELMVGDTVSLICHNTRWIIESITHRLSVSLD